MKNNVNLEQYVISRIAQYPTLYNGNSFFESKMRVLDQFLNTIGNGIQNNEDLLEHIECTDTKVTMNDISHIIDGSPLFSGYSSVTNYGNLTIPDLGSRVVYAVTEKEKDKYPTVIRWIRVSNNPIELYPNFEKQYSTVWRCSEYMNLDKSFIQGAIEFYEFSRKWFDEDKGIYCDAFPRKDKQDSNRYIDDIKIMFEKYKSNEEISAAYHLEYNGDVEDFLTRRWIKEKQRIFGFIDGTLNFLTEGLK